MRWVWSLSVMQRAVLILVLGVISALALTVIPVMIHVHSAHAAVPLFTLLSVLALGAFAASIWISYDLRAGIESERWPEQQIDRFRDTFNTPLAMGVYTTVAIASLCFAFFNLLSRHYTHGAGYGLLMLTQNLSQLLIAARRPKPRSPVPLIDWNSGPRITSAHWGRHK